MAGRIGGRWPGLIRATPVLVPVFVDTDYTRLCLGYYVNGPDWLCCGRPSDRVINRLDPATVSGSLDSAGDLAGCPRDPAVACVRESHREPGGQTYLFPDAEFPEGVVAVRAAHSAG